MSIKKLFGSTEKTNNYIEETNEKLAFEDIESSRNLEQLSRKQDHFQPQIDYNYPERFARFGSAILYYKSAFTRILDYYPYDGSAAEINKFYNESLDIEKYILDNLYPRTNGYITFNEAGYGGSTITADGYGSASNQEHIDFKGGPGTGSVTSTALKDLAINNYSDKFNDSNIYDTDLYQTDGLPSTYGKGTRTSNLRSDFDEGVTLEFWFKSGSINSSTETQKQVIFDWWNNEDTSSADYGRIILELTSAVDTANNRLRPFMLTVQSGSSTTRNILSLGSSSLWNDMGSWHHYTFRLKNSGSVLGAQLYVDGGIHDENSWGKYTLSSSFVGGPYKYNSSTNLQAWYRLNVSLAATGAYDVSGKGRDGPTPSNPPTLGSGVTPSPTTNYINTNSQLYDGINDAIGVGTAATWDAIIGNDTAGGSTEKMTFSAWVYKTGDGGNNKGSIFWFGDETTGRVRLWTTSANAIQFSTYWSGGGGTWYTAASKITNDEWTHITLTYDATATSNEPILYVNGVVVALSTASGPSGTWGGIMNDPGYIGNRDDGTYAWEGYIADFAIWNSVLSHDDILAIYHASDWAKLNTAITTLKPNAAVGRIGALLTGPAGSSATSGDGKLAASLDEFRFWKVARSPREIGENYFTQVRGGVNTDISNTTLGVYYKFNEGITTTASVDMSVLDYAGRVTNGVWTGYTSTSRNVGSAIVSASAAVKEYKDPIIRDTNQEVIALRSELVRKGEVHDFNNNASMLSLLPGWILEDQKIGEDTDLQNMCHIIGAYFDKLYLQISQIPRLRHLTYTSSSHKPIPFAEHLPQSLGLYSPELFIDASVREKFTNRDNNTLFEGDLNDTKNLIYSNLYNNLTAIFKAKGTEKAIRNVFRCFNVDEKLLRLTINSNRDEYTLRNNLQQTLVNKNCANFNSSSNINAVIYQASSSATGFGPSSGYITGSSKLNPYGFTAETNIIFPHFDIINDKVNGRNFLTSSLFGMTTVNAAMGASAGDNLTGVDTTFVNGYANNTDYANFQVYAIRDEDNSKNVRFMLTSSYGGEDGVYPFPTLTSSIFLNVYDNQQWNISVRIKPSNYPNTGMVGAGSDTYTYDVIFHGINTISDTIANSFTVTGSMTKAQGHSGSAVGKRLYVGAERTNLTGAILNKSDVLISSTKYWTKYLEDSTLRQHALDVENIGISGSMFNLSPLDSNSGKLDILNSDTLALNWNFLNVTASNLNGNFPVQDFSSGSNNPNASRAGWLGPITKYQHAGYGYGFQATASNVMDKRHMNSYRFVNPEQVVASDMITIFDDEDRMYPPTEFVPNYVYSIEKSIYNAITEEMLDFFAGVVDFNTVIGAPVNRYRHRYKQLEHLRESFFRRVSKVTQVEKYLNYYKWFDDAISSIIGQLVPASSEYVDDILNVVESHVLERPKYQTRFPTLNFMNPEVQGFIHGLTETYYSWLEGHSTLKASPRPTDKHVLFWKERAVRTASEISSSSPTVDAARETFRKTIYAVPHLSASTTVVSSPDGTQYVSSQYPKRAFGKTYRIEAGTSKGNPVSASTFRGGVNFSPTKNLEFARAAVWPAGPINNESGAFVPENVLIAFPEDYVKQPEFKNAQKPPSATDKIHRVYKVNHGRDWQDGMGYSNVKSTVAFPFNIISASVSGGYIDHVHVEFTGNIDITNLHNDVYGPMMEKPMQGPFTDYAVGGLQSRHIPVNFKATDTWHTRPEAFRILLGSCLGPPGAIGVVGPDYPWPEANNIGDRPYPLTGSKKAYLYRDFVAKAPVNIKNIQMRTGSTILGNYTQQYEILNSFGSYVNPRHFLDNQPPLPTGAFSGPTRYATQIKTYLDVRRNDGGHRQLLPDYSIAYLTGTKNQQIITTRFSNPGGIKTMGVGYRDFRGSEYSVYNATTYRNTELIKPSQGPSGTISQPTGAGTTGIRVYDIHGKDFGLRAHLARHTARFGRDSLHVLDPGASYEQLPAMYKVNRNNKERLTVTETLIAQYSGPRLVNTKGVAWPADNVAPKGSGFLITGSDYQTKFLYDGINCAPAYALTAWILPQNGSNKTSAKTVFSIGYSTIGSRGIEVYTADSASGGPTDPGIGGGARLNIKIPTILGGAQRQAQWETVSGNLQTGSWNHIAVVYSASVYTDVASVDPVVYINGVSEPLTEITAPHATLAQLDKTYNNFRDNSALDVDGPVLVGTGLTPGTAEYTGSIDEVAFLTGTVSAADITTIYNGGVPCDLTASSFNSASLVAWYRMGDGANDSASIGTNDIFTTRIYNIVTNDDNDMMAVVFDNGGVNTDLSYVTSVKAGCTPPFSGYSSALTYTTKSLYDNYFIKHPIPRSDRQYRWITRSLSDPNSINYVGFQRTFGNHEDRAFRKLSGTSSVYFYDFVTASAEKGTAPLAGGYQPIGRLNTITLDAVSGTENTLGFPAGSDAGAVYINSALNNPANIPSASYLNLLLSRRQATYGWTWQMWRTGKDHPLLLSQAQNNTLSAITGSDLGLYNFSLPPLSMKGRTSQINYDARYMNPFQAAAGKRNNITLRSSHTNEKIYFNEVLLDNITTVSPNRVFTPLNEAIRMTKKSSFRRNWIVYRQNIFPSLRNEFTTRSSGRVGYDNGFWRNLNSARVDLGAETRNSFKVKVSQSAWCLDAPIDFLTRSGPPTLNVADYVNSTVYIARSNGKSGELQNTYLQYLKGDMVVGSAADRGTGFRFGNIVPSALYARKHMLGSPRSVVAPSGMDIPETGAIPSLPSMAAGNGAKFGLAEFSSVSASNPYSGESLWEAPSQAGIIIKSGSTSKFLVSASNPWFNDYDSFHADLKLAARGYSIVPEFRISDHVDDYIRYGSLNIGVTDTFNIPGTGINSTTASFYKDYSNTDFLQGVLKLKNDSLLEAREIKLTCHAAIRFNPYKGFYPAQRTLDLASQFSRSYGPGLVAPGISASAALVVTGATAEYGFRGGLFRPIMQPLFAPGIMYNSIKSGLAVDYPILTNQDKFAFYPYGGTAITGAISGPSLGYSPDNYVLGYSGLIATSSVNATIFSGSFWDKRIPFEAIIEPDIHLRNTNFLDMEPHPSCSLSVTSSWAGAADEVYTRMASNFFGEVGNFFLRDRDFTNLESHVIPTDLKFEAGDVYGARLILRRSMEGPRTYQFETGSMGHVAEQQTLKNPFTMLGGRAFVADDPATSPVSGAYTDAAYPLPQDPKRNPEYRENFTMYSRPTAFGPPVTGRRFWTLGAAVTPGAGTASLGMSGTMDCFDGYNWSFTPPYYHGEAWADFIFRPSGSVSYDLEKIMAEMKVVYWRADSGPHSGSISGTPGRWVTPLIPGGNVTHIHGNIGGWATGGPYNGNQVNVSAMQLSSSFNLFGVQRVFETTGQQGGVRTNKTIGQKWIIQPKWETPMLNFNDKGIHPITSGSSNLTIPVYGSGSVTRGMWHQFGTIPQDPDKGVFLSMEDIPVDWLAYHWMVINSASVYNDYTISVDSAVRFNAGKKYKSLTQLFGFDKAVSKVRLGELAEERVIHEAVVAIPYVLVEPDNEQNLPECSQVLGTQKKFINIPPRRIEAAFDGAPSAAGSDSLKAAGRSIRRLVQKMQRYVLPPQFDFLNNKKVPPVVMYIFEFKYKLDRDDLSYIWQNLAPRDYQKMKFQKSSVAHELFNTELLTQNNLLQNPNLRWMVFKVKEKSQTEYWDLIADQAGAASTEIFGAKKKKKEGYQISYNWPYDFISFVEAIKVDVDVLYKNPSNPTIANNETDQEVASQNAKDAQAQGALQNNGNN
jgi:hypothetical protein